MMLTGRRATLLLLAAGVLALLAIPGDKAGGTAFRLTALGAGALGIAAATGDNGVLTAWSIALSGVWILLGAAALPERKPAARAPEAAVP